MSALLALKAKVESQQTQLAAMQQKIDELNARINGVAFAVPPGVSAGQKLQLQVPGIGMVAPEMPAEVVAGQQIRITFPAKPVLVSMGDGPAPIFSAWGGAEQPVGASRGGQVGAHSLVPIG